MNLLNRVSTTTGLALLTAGVTLTGFSVSANAFTIIPGNTITLDQVLVGTDTRWQIDDKWFYDFTYAPSPGVTPTDPNQVTLIPINNSPSAVGFTASALFNSTSPNGDIGFSYYVEVIPGSNKFIKDAYLGVENVSSGTVTVAETIHKDSIIGPTIGVLNATASNTVTGSDSVDLTEQVKKIFVSKDIELAGTTTVPVSFSTLVQTVSQTTPEPSSFLAFGLITASLFLYPKRQK